MKKLLPWLISAVLFVIVIWGCFDLGYIGSRYHGTAVPDKETAIKIAEAVLGLSDFGYQVIDKNSYWIVYTLSDYVEGIIITTWGGDYQVNIRKKDGRILYINVID